MVTISMNRLTIFFTLDIIRQIIVGFIVWTRYKNDRRNYFFPIYDLCKTILILIKIVEL